MAKPWGARRVRIHGFETNGKMFRLNQPNLSLDNSGKIDLLKDFADSTNKFNSINKIFFETNEIIQLKTFIDSTVQNFGSLNQNVLWNQRNTVHKMILLNEENFVQGAYKCLYYKT